jgi:signal transduction histidine kinase
VSSTLAIVLLAGLGVACVVSVGWALRSRRELAALRVRQVETERVSRARTRTVAAVAHDLRTPLTALIGFTELLLEGRAGALNARQDEYLGVVRSSAGHLLTLVDETLDTASIEAGHVSLRPRPVDPGVVAAECVAALAPLAAGRRVVLDHRRAPLGPALLDAARLRQVIDNLVGNAIKFTEPGGRVVVSLTRSGGRLIVAVADTGIGIAAADRERIFEEFVRLRDGRRAGNGLGLAVTRQIVTAQGGGVDVDAAPGQGSTFTAWLPWVEVTAEDRARLQADDPVAPDPFGAGAGLGYGAGRGRRFSPRGGRRAPGRADAASPAASARAARP